jgi:hypothetical protein
MEFTLKDEQLQDIVQAAVLASITPENRNSLIVEAIKQLLARPVGSNFEKRSQLQQIFDRSAISAAEKYITEALAKDDTFTAEISKLIQDASAKCFGPNREKMVESLSNHIRLAITEDRY